MKQNIKKKQEKAHHIKKKIVYLQPINIYLQIYYYETF